MELTKKLTFLLLLSVCSINCFPSRPLNDRPSELTWQAWLLVDSQSQLQNESDRRITPKSVFIAPKLNGQRNDTLPDCPEGYKSDSMGRCVKLVKVDEAAHLNFLLQRLNEMYAQEEEEFDEDVEDESVPTAGPLQFNIPLGQDEDISTIDANTNGQFNVDGLDDKTNVKRQQEVKKEEKPTDNKNDNYNTKKNEDNNAKKDEDYNDKKDEDYNNKKDEDYNDKKEEDYNDKKDEDYNDKKEEDYDKKDEDYNNKKDEDYDKQQDEYDDMNETTTQTEPTTIVTDATTEITTTIPTTEEGTTEYITTANPNVNDDLKALFFLMPANQSDNKNGLGVKEEVTTEKYIEMESIIAQTSSISQAVHPKDKETIEKVEDSKEKVQSPFIFGQKEKIQPIIIPPKITLEPVKIEKENLESFLSQLDQKIEPILFQHKIRPENPETVSFQEQPVLYQPKDQPVLFHQKDKPEPIIFQQKIEPTILPKPFQDQSHHLKLNLRFPDTTLRFPEAIEVNHQKNHNNDFNHYYTGSQETHHKRNNLTPEQIEELVRQFAPKSQVDRREATQNNHRNRDRYGELWNLSPVREDDNNNKHLRYGRYPPPYYPQGLYNPKHLAPHHEVQYYGEETPQDYTFGRKRRRGNLR